MALDPLVVLCPPLQEYFVDKGDGTPLSGGVVTFYEDSNRTVLKPIYTLNQSTPYSDSSYIELPNPIILSSVGTFVDDNGNDIVPYLFPYDGVPGNTNEEIDLYYITVYSAAGVFQFSRSAWPNTTDTEEVNSNSIKNYIPNGQFLLHNNFPVTSNITTAVPANADVTYIAQGGWTFQVPHNTVSENAVSFIRQNSPSVNPDESADPRYVLDVQCTSPSLLDTFKDICITFPDVNKFASNSAQNNYTFSFQGFSLSGFPLDVEIRLLKYFGSGGSPSTSIDTSFGVGEITINTTNGIYNVQGLFGNNATYTLGSNDDDYLQIVIRLPNLTSHIQITNFILTDGAVSIQGFPQTTNAKMLDESTAGWLPTPDPNGFDVYLPLVFTPKGAIFSDADIGKIYAALYTTLPIGELDCDGTQYLTEGYSSDGIPYARLQNKWFDSTNCINFFGNGSNYATANFTNVTPGSSSFRLNISSPGSGTIADFNTTFTFATINNGLTTGCVGYTEGGVTVIDNTIGTRTAPNANTSGFTIVDIRNTSNSYHIFSVTPVLPVTGGTYFTFTTAINNFYMWFTVDGSGSDPMPGGVGIQVNLLSTYNVNEVARCIKDAISGYQTTHILPVSGSSIVQNSYFTIITPSPTTFYVWYNLNGAGNDPLPLVDDKFKIEVNVLTADTTAIITTKTITAINMKYFAIPNLRGQFLRGWDNSAGVDQDIAGRFTQNDYFLLNKLGSFEIDDFFSHLHANTVGVGSLGVSPSSLTPGTAAVGPGVPIIGNSPGALLFSITGSPSISNALAGGNETVPKNCYIRWIVKY